MLKWENPMRSNNKPSIWGWYVYDWVTTLFNGWAYGNIRKPRFFWKTNFPPSVGLFPVDFHIIRFWEMHARSDIDDHWCSMRRSKETKEDPENIWEPIQKAEFPHVCNDCDVILVSCAPTSVKTHNSKPIRTYHATPDPLPRSDRFLRDIGPATPEESCAQNGCP